MPPGDIIDYVRLLRAEHPDKKFSVKLVSRVWGQHFADKLRIRGTTHHSKCSVCIRHRLIVKRVGVGPARAAQLAELQKHLRLQYADRCCYWSTRSRSRLESDSLESTTVISGILDSMDQAKHCWPRSEAMSSKDFNSWGRPKMSSTTLILHGYGVVGALSPPQVPTNSSRTVEVLSFGLTRCVQVGVDWRQVALHLQSDNCAKECKNQTVLRFLGRQPSPTGGPLITFDERPFARGRGWSIQHHIHTLRPPQGIVDYDCFPGVPGRLFLSSAC